MATAHPSTKLTEEKYLAVERQAEEKSEYLGGEMFAMAGANRLSIASGGWLCP